MKNNAIRVLTTAAILFGALSAQAQETAPPTTTTSPDVAPATDAPAQSTTSNAPQTNGADKKQESASSPPASPDAKPATSAAGQSLTEEDREFIRRGYQIQVRNGEKTYCKKQTTVGSRLNAKTLCVRADELKAMREDVQDSLREKVRNNRSEP
jgi:hypothetical protein